MARKCKIEECESIVFGKGYCKFHYPRTTIKKISEKGLIKKEKKKEYTQKQWELFMEIWAERPHICFETGVKIYGEPLSTMFHHCIYKSVRPDLALVKENIVLITPDVHQTTHIDINKTPKIKAYTEYLKEKYG